VGKRKEPTVGPPHAALLRDHRSRKLAAGLLACALVAGVAWSFARTGGGQASTALWVVLASNRDGAGNVDLGVDRRAYAVRPDGSGLTDLLGKGRTLNPISLSADGSAIAYGAGEFPTSIYVSRADGTGLRRAAHAGGGRTIDAAVLSPDGEELAYTSVEPDRHHRLFVVGVDGRDRRDLGAGAAPDWSADGKKLVFVTGKGCGVGRVVVNEAGRIGAGALTCAQVWF